MADEPNYYRNKKRMDAIRNIFKWVVLIGVFGGLAVFLALFLVNVLFRSGPPESGTSEQVARLEQLENSDGGSAPESGGGAVPAAEVDIPEPELREFDSSIPLTNATPDLAVTPLDENGDPIGGSASVEAPQGEGPSPELNSGEAGGDDGPAESAQPETDTEPDETGGTTDPEPTPAQREAERFAREQSEQASTASETESDSDTQQDSEDEQENSEEADSGSDQQEDQSGDDESGDESNGGGEEEDLMRYQLITPAVSSRSTAERVLQTVEGIGFNGFIEDVVEQGETRYRVNIEERFASYEAAKSAMQRLQEAGVDIVPYKSGG